MTEQQAIRQLNGNLGVLDFSQIAVARAVAVKALQDIQQYHAIGTISECSAAMEKQKMKRPFKSPDGHMNCVVCEEVVIFPLEYCQNCGQRTDWSEVDNA